MSKKKSQIEEEVADIFNYLILFCEKTEIDLEEATLKKIKVNEEKYPANVVKGKSNKYTEYKQK